MGVKVTFNDNSGRLLAKMQGNARRALTAMGTKAVGLTVQKMQSGYGRPIRRTGVYTMSTEKLRDTSSRY